MPHYFLFFYSSPACPCPCHRLHTTVPPQSSTSWKMIDETENTLNRMGDLFSGQICMSTWGTRGRAPARTIFFSFFLAAAPAHEASTEDGRRTAASRRLYQNFPRPGKLRCSADKAGLRSTVSMLTRWRAARGANRRVRTRSFHRSG